MILTKPKKKSTTRKFELSLAVSLVGDEFGTLLEQLTAAPHGQSPQPRDVDVAVAEQSGVVERFDVDAVVLQPTLHLQRHREARNRALVPLKSALCRFCCRSRRRGNGRWRQARGLACHSPVRAVAGDYSNDCQRAFGMS
jgi:hypothetical protein